MLGYEPYPDQYVEHLSEIFTEVKRVLRDDGNFWLNIGDSYAKDNKLKDSHGIKKKDLLGIPWIAAQRLRKDGWYLRNDCIWAKLGGFPDSTKDRFGRMHEYVFHFSKSEKYYFDHLAVREPASASSIARINQKNFDNQKGGEKDYGKTGVNLSRSARKTIENFAKNPGANIKNVWRLPTAQLRGIKHFAAFPSRLAEICIKSSTSEYGVSPTTGEPFVRVTKSERKATRNPKNIKEDKTGKACRDPLRHVTSYETIGWNLLSGEICEPIPSLVLDPFSGSGQSGMAAIQNGRSYIGIELSPEYVDISSKRIQALDPLFVQRVKQGETEYDII